MIPRDLLEILVCPKCRGPVTLTEAGDALVCETDRLAYPITDGIPVMLVEEAKPL